MCSGTSGVYLRPTYLGYLGSVGVTTPVSTVHTWVNIRSNPTLCGADFVGANAQ